MKILFLYGSTINPIVGGIERVTSVLSDYFEKEGHQVYYISLVRDSDVKYVNRQFFFPNSIIELAPENVEYLLSFVKKNKIEIVVNQYGIGKEMSRLAYNVKFIGVKLISVVHNSFFANIDNFDISYKSLFEKYHIDVLLPIAKNKAIKWGLFQLLKLKYKRHVSELCYNSDYVILLSDKFKHEIEFIGGPKCLSNVVGISNPCSFNDVNVEYSRKKNELLYVGRIDKGKKVDLLLEIWNKLYYKYPNWVLKIVGDGEDLSLLKSRAIQMRLKNVFFEGFQPSQSYYEEASIFCMTSAYESFGIVLIEAMQCMTIPVAFNSYRSITDIIDDKINGYLVSPFNIDEYALVLSSLIDDDELRKNASINAFEKSCRFDISNIGNIWLDLFTRCLNN